MLITELLALEDSADSAHATPPVTRRANSDGDPSPVGGGYKGPKGGSRYFACRTLERVRAVDKRASRKRSVTASALKRERVDAGCEVCGWRMDDGSSRGLHAHHVLPVACGGTDVRENQLVLCPNHHALAHALWPIPRRWRTWTGPTNRDEALAQLRVGG